MVNLIITGRILQFGGRKGGAWHGSVLIIFYILVFFYIKSLSEMFPYCIYNTI